MAAEAGWLYLRFLRVCVCVPLHVAEVYVLMFGFVCVWLCMFVCVPVCVCGCVCVCVNILANGSN